MDLSYACYRLCKVFDKLATLGSTDSTRSLKLSTVVILPAGCLAFIYYSFRRNRRMVQTFEKNWRTMQRPLCLSHICPPGISGILRRAGGAGKKRSLARSHILSGHQSERGGGKGGSSPTPRSPTASSEFSLVVNFHHGARAPHPYSATHSPMGASRLR